jgi:hypothetical protein
VPATRQRAAASLVTQSSGTLRRLNRLAG